MLPIVTIALGLLVYKDVNRRLKHKRPRVAAKAAVSLSAPTPDPRPTRDIFDQIYKQARWTRNADGSGSSGDGSSLRSTVVYRAFLQQFMKDNAIKSVVDAGCGDWEFSQAIDWTGIDYRGFDIVDAVIEADKQKYGRPGVQFFTANIVEDDLPPADLLISKHVLQHLPNADVLEFLEQLPKYKHVLLINGIDSTTFSAPNRDIVAGDYRELDVTAPPFRLAGAKVLNYWDGIAMHQVVYIAGKRPVSGT